MVRLTQTKWNGTVCQSCQRTIATMLIAAKAAQARSGHRAERADPVSGMADGFDDVAAELGAQAADAHVDDIGARVERVAPDLRQQLGAGAHGAAVGREVLEQQELALAQVDRPSSDVR